MNLRGNIAKPLAENINRGSMTFMGRATTITPSSKKIAIPSKRADLNKSNKILAHVFSYSIYPYLPKFVSFKYPFIEIDPSQCRRLPIYRRERPRLTVFNAYGHRGGKASKRRRHPSKHRLKDRYGLGKSNSQMVLVSHFVDTSTPSTG